MRERKLCNYQMEGEGGVKGGEREREREREREKERDEYLRIHNITRIVKSISKVPKS